MAQPHDQQLDGPSVIRTWHAAIWAMALFVLQLLVNGYDSFSGLSQNSTGAHPNLSPGLWWMLVVLLVLAAGVVVLWLNTAASRASNASYP